jgi:uncharacterized Zn finger protein
MTTDVKMTEELKVTWSDKMKEIKFKPSENLKKGDKVKITVEKVYLGRVENGRGRAASQSAL